MLQSFMHRFFNLSPGIGKVCCTHAHDVGALNELTQGAR